MIRPRPRNIPIGINGAFKILFRKIIGKAWFPIVKDGYEEAIIYINELEKEESEREKSQEK